MRDELDEELAEYDRRKKARLDAIWWALEQCAIRTPDARGAAILLERRDQCDVIAIFTDEAPTVGGERQCRVTYLWADGPYGHTTRSSMLALVEDVADYYAINVRPLAESEVIERTSTPEYLAGAAAVAEVQRHNSRWLDDVKQAAEQQPEE